ncbi:MAG TPA: hypothetical protein VLV32_03775, partial [Burkholderiales bacterium]|nr:hypothetical protein [Burkholderiales bacterium]
MSVAEDSRAVPEEAAPPESATDNVSQTFQFPAPEEKTPFTGERYVPGLLGDIQHEHYHRYLFALRFCAD